MSCSKLITNLRPYQPFFQCRQLSSLSEIRQSSMKLEQRLNAKDSISSDIVIIGDGVLDNSIAYWLRATNPYNQSVTVVESEKFIQNRFNIPTNSQFNSIEAIQLSKFTNNFIRRLNADFKLRPNQENAQTTNLSTNHEALCVQKYSIGLLQLTESIYGESELIKYNKLFKQLFGSTEYASELLNSKQLSEMFTWLNSENVRLARFHARDDLALTNINLTQLNDILKSKGVKFVKGKIKEMNTNNKYEEDIYGVTTLRKNCNELLMDRFLNQNLRELTNLKFKKLILACSADQSSKIANLLALDKNYQWPMEVRQRFIYEIQCDNLKDKNVPAIVDSFGFWLKKDQSTGNFYCGLTSQENLDKDEKLNKVTNFSKFLWPRLLKYASALRNIEIVNVYEQNYDFNLIDDNGIIGAHPDIGNIFFVLGFFGQNEIWAPGLGKATADLISPSKRSDLVNLDKSFSWQRVLKSSRLKQHISN